MLQQMLFITSLNGLVVSLTKRRAHSFNSFNRNTQDEMGDCLHIHALTTVDRFHTLHDTDRVKSEGTHY